MRTYTCKGCGRTVTARVHEPTWQTENRHATEAGHPWAVLAPQGGNAVSPSPPRSVPASDSPRISGCSLGCGVIVVLLFLTAAIGAATGDRDSHEPDTREQCRSRWAGAGDGTVDWRGICDVK